MLLKNNRERFIFDKSANIFLEVLTFVSSLSMEKSFLSFIKMQTSVQDFVYHKLLFSINKENFSFVLTNSHFGVKSWF